MDEIMSIINSMFRKLTFLSFADTSDSVSGFIDDLKAALQGRDIFTFSSDRSIMAETAESVQSSNNFKVIQGCQIYIVVFTRNYADSVCCLEELVKIAHGISTQRIVIPIFYRVSAAHVQNQSSYYQGAFADHEEKFGHSLEQVQRWRVAMKQVASLRGWHAWIGSESQVVDDIVRYIMKKLSDDCPVGMETRVNKFDKFLNIGSGYDNDVGFVGISGMCGIGKTCLAQEVYDIIYHRFDAHYFLSNVDQPILQQLEECLMDDNNKPRCCKTLLVIDNVKEYDQVKVLARNLKWFGGGSRIIVTTRDKSILRCCYVHKIFEVELLNNDEAHELFCRHAHIRHNVDHDDEEFIHCVLKYANGLPLAIQSLGCSLRGRNPLERRSFLEELKEHPDSNIMDPLVRSLYENKGFELEMFFYVACFFNGKDKSDVIRILDSLNFCDNKLGILMLQDKSLISIRNGKIWMHNLLEQVGREIAERLSLFSEFQYVDLELLEQALHPNHYASTIRMDYKGIQSDKDWKYRAFISFADVDDSFSTFIQHLIAALQRQDIFTFSADRRMVKTAKSAPTEIFEEIQESQICIIVFTRNYADSVWCLEELAKIAQGISQRIVIPIFYRVSPVKVRKQSSYFQGPFEELEEKFRDNLDQAE